MVPSFIDILGAPWSVLPEGVHAADLESVARAFATNSWRRRLFEGLVEASRSLLIARCQRLYLNGSFTTRKPMPDCYDACWDSHGVKKQMLDPVFLDFSNGRVSQETKYQGVFYPVSRVSSTSDIDGSDGSTPTFLDFFQVEKFTGLKSGIILIELDKDPMLVQEVST